MIVPVAAIRIAYAILFNIIIFAVLSIIYINRLTGYIKKFSYAYKNLMKSDFNYKIEGFPTGSAGLAADNFNESAIEIKDYIDSMKMLLQKKNDELFEANDELLMRNNLMKSDLKIAQKVQDALIPKEFPGTGMLRIYGSYMPMEDLGGDYYDVFKITSTRIAVVMSDVSGHGGFLRYIYRNGQGVLCKQFKRRVPARHYYENGKPGTLPCFQ